MGVPRQSVADMFAKANAFFFSTARQLAEHYVCYECGAEITFSDGDTPVGGTAAVSPIGPPGTHMLSAIRIAFLCWGCVARYAPGARTISGGAPVTEEMAVDLYPKEDPSEQ